MAEFNKTIYGVRKGDIDDIKKQKNWINLEDHVIATLEKLDDKVFVAGALSRLAKDAVLSYNSEKMVDGITNDKSPAKVFLKQLVGLPSAEGFPYLAKLLSLLNIKPKVDADALVVKYEKELRDFNNRYSLVRRFDHHANEGHMCEYINLVDEVKGV
jgi:hypothetical protein